MRDGMCARLAWAILTTSLLWGSPAVAELRPKVAPAIIIIIDLDEAMQASNAGLELRNSYDSIMRKMESEAGKFQKNLMAEENELLRTRGTVPQDDWEQRARAHEKKTAEAISRNQLNIRDIQNAYKAARSELQRALTEVTEETAEQVGATLILPKSQTFLHDARMDVTKQVIEKLNKRLPSLKINLPALRGIDLSAEMEKKDG